MVKVIQMCSKLEELLLEKKYFSYGDSPQLHTEKVLHKWFSVVFV